MNSEYESNHTSASIKDYIEKTKSSIRKEHQVQRLGDPNPVCVICGYSEPEGLVKASCSLLEDHHIAYLHVGPTVSLCRNCHAEQSEKQRNWSEPMKNRNRSPLVTLAALLQGLCEFINSIAEHLLYWVSWLLHLDNVIPDEVWKNCSVAPIVNSQGGK